MSNLIVLSGDYKSRYVGRKFYGFQTDPVLDQTDYSLFVQKEAAFDFIDANALEVQAGLKKLGVKTEVISLPGQW
jgi:hypothetical protein